MCFLLFALVLGSGLVLGKSSKEDSGDTASKLTSGFLKSRSAGRYLSYSSSFGSEDFDSPDIPSDFHARFGINKTWGLRTPHPILSRRVSFEDYGRPPFIDSMDMDSSEVGSSSKLGEDHLKVGANLPVETPSSIIKKNTTLNSITNNDLPKTKTKVLTTKIKTTQKIVPSPLLEPLPEHKQNLKVTLASKQTNSSHYEKKIIIGAKLEKKTNEEAKTTIHAVKSSRKVTERPSFHTAITTQGRKFEPSKTQLQKSQAIDTEGTSPSTHLANNQPHSTTSSVEPTHKPSTVDDHLYMAAHNVPDDMLHMTTHTTVRGQSHSLYTPTANRLKARAWGPALPRLDRSKKRKENVMVLKPPPEDWPEPKVPDGAKPFPPAPEFGATVPVFQTHVDPRLGRKGKAFSSSSYASPPYMGHRKLDLAEAEPVITPAPFAKWRIKGRRDRLGLRLRGQKGGGYLNEIGKDPGFKNDITLKPTLSQFFISDNTTFLIPTIRNTRPFQRSYVNFRFRPPVNVGRSHSHPGPPFAQPPPPHFGAHFGQPHFPQFPQRPFPPFPPPPPYGPPPYPPPPPFGRGPPPPPPPPPFGQGLSPHFRRGPLPPKFAPDIPSAPPPEMVMFPRVPLPRGPPDPFPAGPPPPPPSPYPTGPNLPPPRPFLENIPTISPIDGVPAPWPRRHIQTEFLAPPPRAPEFFKQEPRNLSEYKGPRRGRAYEQYGKADLRPRQVKFFDDFAARPRRMPLRKGSGFGVEFQDDITRPPFVSGSMFARKTWPTKANRFGYEPYRRSSDRRRPYGFGRFAAERPPVLGDFGEFKPYRRLDNGNYVPFNYSRPTRSYTFPPRLRLAIKNATYYRKTFRRSSYPGYTLPTLPSIGLEAFMAHQEDYYGNPITPKGRIMNLQDLKSLFTFAPETEGVEAEEEVTAPVVVVTDVPEEKKRLVPRITPKPKGMTAREAMRAAAREAIKEAELEAWEAGEGRRRRRGGRRVGGAGPFVRRGGARGTGHRNFRRVKRSLEEDAAWLEQLKLLEQELYDSGDYLTGPGAHSTSSSSARGPRRGSRSKAEPPLRMRRVLLRRGRGRPLRHS